MKNLLNISSKKGTQLCSLCQDTLLRHIRQSKVFWYCPSCRQEMVGEEQEGLPKPAVTPHHESDAQSSTLPVVPEVVNESVFESANS